MRTVFTNDEIVHVWASQNQSYGKANSMRFDGVTLWSYRMPIGQFQKRDDGTSVVLLDRTSRSITTSAHQSRTIQAVSHLDTIEVGEIDEYRRGACESNQRWYNDEIEAAIKKAARARQQWNQDYALSRANRLASDMLTYSELFKLGWAVPVVPTDLAAAKIQVKVESKEKAAANKARIAEQTAKAIELRDAWFAGGRFEYGWSTFLPTELRIVGDEIETSRGAKFPLSHAKRGLALVEAVVARGQEWRRNGQTCKLGFYQIDRIEANGTVHAGCHVVPFAAILRIRESIVSSKDNVVSEVA